MLEITSTWTPSRSRSSTHEGNRRQDKSFAKKPVEENNARSKKGNFIQGGIEVKKRNKEQRFTGKRESKEKPNSELKETPCRSKAVLMSKEYK